MKTLRKISAALLAAALLALAAGCAKGNASGPIRIATKPMTEQYILGEMLGLLIENNTDYKVEITRAWAAAPATSSLPWRRASLTCTRSTPPAAG